MFSLFRKPQPTLKRRPKTEAELIAEGIAIGRQQAVDEAVELALVAIKSKLEAEYETKRKKGRKKSKDEYLGDGWNACNNEREIKENG